MVLQAATRKDQGDKNKKKENRPLRSQTGKSLPLHPALKELGLETNESKTCPICDNLEEKRGFTDRRKSIVRPRCSETLKGSLFFFFFGV